MARSVKRTLVRIAVETTAGTFEAPAAADAIIIADATFDVDYQPVQRNLLRPYFGHSGSLTGSQYHKLDFTTELSGSGAAGTAPAWGKLLLGCAFAETVTASTMVEYTPITDGRKTVSLEYFIDGVLYKTKGAMGTVSFNLAEGGRPELKFMFVGAEESYTAVSAPATDFTAWLIPEVIKSGNTAQVTLGGTYAAGAITGGTGYCSRGLTLDMANDAKYKSMLGCAGADITDRAPTGHMALELSAAQEVTFRDAIAANTLTSISMLHGSAAGKQVLFYAPGVRRTNLKAEDYEGTLLSGMDLELQPITGNDELRIVCL